MELRGPVLCATDLSDAADAALRQVSAISAQRVGFRLVHCLDIDEAAYVGGIALPGAIAPWPLPREVIDQLEAAARKRLSAALADTHVDGEPLVIRQPPARGILEAAQAVATALIVVGTRGRTGLVRLALGSVAESVINRAACSVLVVPLHPA